MTDLRAACIHGRYEAHRFEVPDGDWVKWESCSGGREVTEAEIITAYLTRTNATGGNVDADAI